ncbi:response regulator [Pyxidicoccus xibeiensis]|uniref:response regulator n=1 Tax=Pyxidicoccus xibeiensis TaxID=2906759 RepID=UPI0020A7B9C3|nr:response regulator [Pyxidicoccus xibeiensis]MCP3144101.1 response regulator [Pyxidicoccus xibeiensis]
MNTVLLVDDEPSLLDLYTLVLEDLGLVVATAVNGEEALRMAPQLRPDLIITDLMMPRMNGLELCLCLQDDPRVRDIPVIIHSSMDAVVTPPGAVFLRKTGLLAEFEAQVARSLALKPPGPSPSLTSAA